LRGVRELVVVSPDIDHGVPIEMLHGPGQLVLAERFTISYIPSAVLYVAHRERHPHVADPRPWQVLVVGSDGSRPLDTSPSGLAQVRSEVEAVRAAFPTARVLLGGEASEARLNGLRDRHALEGFDLIHFSGHQRSDPIFAQDAAVVLAEAYARPPAALPDQVDPHDGRITPAELDVWQLNARLVVLASCQSIGVSGTRSEGIVGAGRALLDAGASSVVVSMWNVDDRATRLLVERFYQELLPRRGPKRTFAEALRAARLHVRDWRAPNGSQPYRHPAYWAAFTLLGEPY
jgi:CHAT domain-containing protein